MFRYRLRLSVQFVWATSERAPAIRPQSRRRLYRYITSVCRNDHCDMLAIGGMPDHVHLLVTLPATLTVSKLTHHVKGGSSHFMASTLQQDGWPGWQQSYGAFSVSPRDRHAVKAYIEGQEPHHGASHLWPEAEECAEANESAAD